MGVGLSVREWQRQRSAPACAPSLEKQDGVDLRVANTAPIIEPDWELLLKTRVAEADRLGLLRSEQRKTAETMKRHAQTPVDLKLPKARVGTKRRMVILDADAVRSMATPVRDVLSGFAARLRSFSTRTIPCKGSL